MNNYKIPVFISLLFVLTCAIACKKKSNSNPFGNAHIATVDYSHSGAVLHYRIVYDQYENVDSIVWVGDSTSGVNGYKAFNYVGSSFIITDANNNVLNVYANTSGMILEILLTDTLFMHYSGTELTSLDTKTPGQSLSTVYYNWSNGDVTSYGPMGAGSLSYYYDLSRNGQPGDILRVNDFLNYGRSYIRTTHLPKGLVSTSDTLEYYAYQYDNMGRISQMVKVVNSTNDSTIYNYKYY